MENDEKFGFSPFELRVLRAIAKISSMYPRPMSGPTIPLQEGWITSGKLREYLQSKSLETRATLNSLADDGLLEQEKIFGVQQYRLTDLGRQYLDPDADVDAQPLIERSSIDSSAWTGIVTPPQIYHVLQIVSQIEDVAEEIQENEARAQIMGLVAALKILLDLPSPPRQGIVALARDPAFANLIQIGTLLAAVVAAVKA
ncbi:hypothetical protein ACLBKT_06230 [Erythrobacter sp. W302b]|uniref:hypothetical protein n=1 Tax=Erythrobacter sp. W302b TaxID=3389874 RepID=UPI00396B458E